MLKLNLKESATYRLDCLFIQPTCGSDNSLPEVLTRKLSRILPLVGKNLEQFEYFAIRAMSTLYAVDSDETQVIRIREQLNSVFHSTTIDSFAQEPSEEAQELISYILKENIQVWSEASGEPLKLLRYEFDDDDALTIRVFTFDNFPSTGFTFNPIVDYPTISYKDLFTLDIQK